MEFHGVTSNPEGVSVGVPQGSIFGPLLFILHVNDLPEAASECSILMYADDTVLFCSSSQASTIEMKLNEELFKIERWLFSNTVEPVLSRTVLSGHPLQGETKIKKSACPSGGQAVIPSY